MKPNEATSDMEVRAADALVSLLEQMSAIKTKDIKFKSTGSHRLNILADIDVFGRKHRLICHVAEDGHPDDVRKALQQLRHKASTAVRDTTPVLIAPYVSPQTRALCEESRVGFLDLEGNACLMVDEVFIGKRSCRSVTAASARQNLSA